MHGPPTSCTGRRRQGAHHTLPLLSVAGAAPRHSRPPTQLAEVLLVDDEMQPAPRHTFFASLLPAKPTPTIPQKSSRRPASHPVIIPPISTPCANHHPPLRPSSRALTLFYPFRSIRLRSLRLLLAPPSDCTPAATAITNFSPIRDSYSTSRSRRHTPARL